ncbi:hypothetical protein M3661_09850 [Paenibacillus sp. MER 180]|uniref:hypothetical protein n=1 Tax=unclassified Paenibacillus TaxID=185978 RepID=UPI0008066C91|nr:MULTISPECIES: hypothetical protein [unclassified Paenibacillus]MCM3290432.1 hypothetical protein [Paenibacillus sp. MER 180]OBY80272.1 hypothetical protein BBG47_06865 [Paenibacillus sp. KS1]
MMDKLRPLIGSNLQVATSLETTTGTLISVDETKLTLRTSSISGYENGQYAVFPLKSISYIRII